jgi:N-acetylmuramoyl-L-alanine amidase
MRRVMTGVACILFLLSCSKDKELGGIQNLSEIDCANAIDPGHGGTNPGAYREIGKDTLYEHPYAYDISLRLYHRVWEEGCIGSLTLKSKEGIRDYVPSIILRTNNKEVLAVSNEIATSQTRSLEDRLVMSRNFRETFRGKQLFWTSVHVDDLIEAGEGKDTVSGVRIIYTPGGEEYAYALKKTFGRLGALRRKDPLVLNGSAEIDKWIHVLHIRGNPIPNKVLIEVGNIRSDTDIGRLRNPVIREVYAKAIADAMAIVVKKHRPK